MSNVEPDVFDKEFDEAARIAAGGSRPFTQTYTEFFRENAPSKNYAWGRHTREIAAELDRAVAAVERGESYYVFISVPPRHGKSDIVSRRFGNYLLCKNPDWEIILGTYGANLSEELSSDARAHFREIGPQHGLAIAEDRDAKASWGIAGRKGKFNAVGLDGAVTGRGANFLIIDDYCKNRREAESPDIRETVWNSYQNDWFTRLAPVHAVIILATRWHEDDLAGRIFKAMRNPEYPQFKKLIFPAQNPDGTWLFPERFNERWYRTMQLTLGSYAWSALFMCSPKPRNGGMLRADLVKIIKPSEVPEGLRWTRGWDLASTEKERIKDNPDFTVGTKSAYDPVSNRLYVADVKRGQWSAPQRDKVILDTAVQDGRSVRVRVEAVAGYKDTYIRMRVALSGKSTVLPCRPRENKVARASIFEALFEAGQVCIVEAPWNEEWINEFNQFPKGEKDDQVDSLGVSAADDVDTGGRMKLS